MMSAMMENLTPPTDNLYKFLAIGCLAAVVLFIALMFQQQAEFRSRWTQAEIELRAAGYQAGSGEPTDAALRKAYFQREFSVAEWNGIFAVFKGPLGHVIGVSSTISFFAFAAWWWRVQRHDDLILRLSAEKLEREEAEAKAKRTIIGSVPLEVKTIEASAPSA